MRPDFDKEMDSLLHRHARARGRDPFDGDAMGATTDASGHLDADELAAFAESALPVDARSFYVAHLADCERCRRQVASLASAAGVEHRFEKHAVARPAEAHATTRSTKERLKERLADIFSPRVLRYVAPALAVILIGTVAFIVMRSYRRAEFVAQRNDAAERIAPAASVNDEARDESADAESEEQQQQQGSPADLNARPSQSTVEGGSPRNSSADANAPSSGEAVTSSASRSRESEPAAMAAAKPQGLATISPASPPTQSDSTAPAAAAPPTQERRAGPRDAAKMKDAETSPVIASPDESSNEGRAQSEERAQPTLGMSSPRSRDDAQGGNRPAARRSQPAAPERGEDDVARSTVTRTIAGHRFQHRDGAWIDVDYKSGMPTSLVRRGTEGFRSLVADMPEIGRAAEQLSDEFVIVVRGRAYRVR